MNTEEIAPARERFSEVGLSLPGRSCPLLELTGGAERVFGRIGVKNRSRDARGWIRTALAAPWLVVAGLAISLQKSGHRVVVDGSNFYFISTPLLKSEIASFRLKLFRQDASAIMALDTAVQILPFQPISAPTDATMIVR